MLRGHMKCCPSAGAGVVHYFGHIGRPTSQIFNPRLYFDYFNPAIILIQKKLRFGHFKIWFGTKAAKIGDFGHLNLSCLSCFSRCFHMESPRVLSEEQECNRHIMAYNPCSI